MNAEILAVGTELLLGQIVNTNAQYISQRLPEVGVNVYYHNVVGDNPKRLKTTLNLALQRSDVVIMTGGLGPTKDDITKETVAEVLNRMLVLDEDCLNIMKSFFSKHHRKMTENNLKQAYLPEGCIIIKNKNGTAPGCIIEHGDKTVIMLPGPPSEMRPMFDDTVIPYLKNKCKSRLVSRFVKIFGIGESAVEDKIIDLVENQTNPTIASYAKPGEVMLRVTASCNTPEEADELINPLIDDIKHRLGDAIYSTDNKELEEVVADLLLEKNVTISIAESCTGGLISKTLTELPGISKVFMSGVVSYSNSSKVDILGVKPETIEKYGTVSKATAIEMAENIRKISNTDIGVSVTGIAGPSGGTDEKPVGLVYVALATRNRTEFKELKLWGERTRIRNVTCLHALDMVRRYLLKI
ncbi:MAG: competence/damage-inducible protein A [Clostridiaceae bacterium]|jgi:nicotinamide-nucleotide amidase|nr:competence/damage-inducible protein A [Clostridiaceae bacterium]